MNVEDFRQYVRDNLQEFISRDYRVEIEFSTKDSYIPVKAQVLQEEIINFGLDGVFEFQIHECETCREYDAERPIHVCLMEYGEEH